MQATFRKWATKIEQAAFFPVKLLQDKASHQSTS